MKVMLFVVGGIIVWAAAAVAWWPIAYLGGAYLGSTMPGIDHGTVLAAVAIPLFLAGLIALLVTIRRWNQGKSLPGVLERLRARST